MRRAAAALALVGCLWACSDEPAAEAGGAGAGSPQEVIAAGKRLFGRNGCQVCHGEEGRADGRMAPALRPPPRDFRDLSGYKQGNSVLEIARSIREGISTGRGGMPAYAHLTAQEREMIARYIASLQEP